VCSAACDGGTQSQTYTVTRPAAYGGSACPASSGQQQSQDCNTQGCPVTCQGGWGPWSACSAACDGGTQSQTYTVTRPAAHGGSACPASSGQQQNQDCNTQGCPCDTGYEGNACQHGGNPTGRTGSCGCICTGTGFSGTNCETRLQGTCTPTQVAHSDKVVNEVIRGTLGDVVIVACNPGYINTNGDQMTCVGPSDVFEPAIECTQCPQGKISDQRGMAECIDCGTTLTSNLDRTACVVSLCSIFEHRQPGFFCPRNDSLCTNSSECIRCPGPGRLGAVKRP
jgi:hypothetical protein